MKPLITCQCTKYADVGSCSATATAEDFLCNVCRDGCAVFYVKDLSEEDLSVKDHAFVEHVEGVFR